MNKKEIAAIEKSFARFEKDFKELQKIKTLFGQTLKLYSDAMLAFTVGLSETEGLLDKVIAAESQDHVVTTEATKEMQETQMSFNLQYLQLQVAMQHENRVYTSVSNIMKTKHDTVKNSIGNIR